MIQASEEEIIEIQRKNHIAGLKEALEIVRKVPGFDAGEDLLVKDIADLIQRPYLPTGAQQR